MYIRKSHRSNLIIFIAAHFALAAVVNLVFFAGNAFVPLASATGGLLTGSLLVNLAFIGVLVGWIILKRGRLRPYDVGLIPAHLPMGIIYTVGFWGMAQVVHLLMSLFTYGSVTLNPEWMLNPGTMIGMILAQIIGNALFEEIAYRGFLFPQIYLHLDALRARPWWRLGMAVLLSQGMFALSHIPNRLYLGMSLSQIAPDLLLLLGWGILYTVIYLRTDNLFLVVGVHALGNAPATLFATSPLFAGGGASLFIYALVVLLLFGIPMIRAYGQRFRLGLDYGTERREYV
ncbi:MAG: CPBP family intramembrane metalloprotease [Anaerolinea sp.]|nr:CPBP family intramembrane metalloprotease [Anaerolinea sp.]